MSSQTTAGEETSAASKAMHAQMWGYHGKQVFFLLNALPANMNLIIFGGIEIFGAHDREDLQIKIEFWNFTVFEATYILMKKNQYLRINFYAKF